MERIKIVFITESEPFYMADAFRYFFSHDVGAIDIKSAFILNYFHVGYTGANRINYLDVLRAFGPINFFKALVRILKGRFSADKQVSNIFINQGIPVFNGLEDINAEDVVKKIQTYQPDYIVAVGVNSLFNKKLLHASRFGCINLHSGIKPEHRGRASIFWALADGCAETGVTVHKIEEGVDTGNVIATRHYTISERSLDKVLLDIRMLGMDALLESLNKIVHHQEIAGGQRIDSSCKPRPYPNLDDLKMFVKNGNRLF
ncbi:formyltransferase family protein [Legionella sp. W05-934-2]|jgi:methionyl-tRNA formyltransferase|uniref:formyltransferase family protein n=1 Tax=Legionella sp. W05-934-2 TaxID=1198649 RepID=UPI0034636F6D